MKKAIACCCWLSIAAAIHATPEYQSTRSFDAEAIRVLSEAAEHDAFLRAVCLSHLYFLGSFDGLSAEERGRGREAAGLFALVESSGPNPPDRERLLAEWLFLLQNLSRESWFAGAEFGQQAMRIESKLSHASSDAFVRALIARGKMLAPPFFGGDPKKGLELLTALRGEHPADPLVQLFYAEALLQSGRRAEARAIAADVLRADPGNDFAAYLVE